MHAPGAPAAGRPSAGPVARRLPRPHRSQTNPTRGIHASLPLIYRTSLLRFARPPVAVASVRNRRGRHAPAGLTQLRRMRRDAVAAAPTAAAASPPIHATVLPADAVVIDIEGAPPLPAEAPGLGCRICHLGPEDDASPAPGSEVIRLGCGCKDELGAAHRQCAEAWFRIKGDRRCEICGSDAKNVTGLEVKKFMEQWHGRRVAHTQTTEERGSHCWRQQPFCNFLLASLLIIFMLPWFLRVNLF